MNTISRPSNDEFVPYYAQYIDRVPAGDILQILIGQHEQLLAIVSQIKPEQEDQSFAPGEWTLKEVIGHLIDAERLFSTRAYCIARGEQAALPGFEQNQYVRAGNFNQRLMNDLLAELSLLRRANILTFSVIDDTVAAQRGTASGNEVSVRAVIYTLAGHFLYHLEDLHTIYLPFYLAQQ